VIIASSILSSRALAPVDILIGTWRQLLTARDGWGRIESLLERMPSLPEPLPLPIPTRELSAEGISLMPPGSTAQTLTDISFSVPAGSAVAVLGPVVANEHLGGAKGWSWVLAAESIGMLIGVVIAIRARPRYPIRLVVLLTFPLASLPLVLGLGAPLVLGVAAAFVGGVAVDILVVMWDTTMQREIPPHLLSRVSAYDWFGSVASMPLGFAVIGPLATVLGLRGTLVLGACWLLATNALIAALPAVRGITAPADASAQGGLAVPAHPAGPGTLDHVAQVVPGPPAQV